MTQAVVIELRGASYEVSDLFTTPQVTVRDEPTSQKLSFRADPRADGQWYDDHGRPLTDLLRSEALEIVLGAARDRAGAALFNVGERYLLVLKGGEVLFGEYVGPYLADTASLLLRTEDGELAVMLRTIRTAVEESASSREDLNDNPEATRVTFSCGHTGGVWADNATPGIPRWCLVCREVVTIAPTPGTNVVPFKTRPPRQ